METTRLTAADFTDGKYTGSHNVAKLVGHLEIEGNLGWVRFDSVRVAGSLVIEAGTGIEAGEGIKAGWGIEAGTGIKAGWGIKAGTGIEAGEGIEAGWVIEAGTGIEAGEGIKAGEGIEAGTGIKAGWGILAGLAITCKTSLSAGLRIFAGVCWWRAISLEEKAISCEKLESGEVAFGELKETGSTPPPESPAENQYSDGAAMQFLSDAIYNLGGVRLAADVLDAFLCCDDNLDVPAAQATVARQMFDILSTKYPNAVTLAQEGTPPAPSWSLLARALTVIENLENNDEHVDLLCEIHAHLEHAYTPDTIGDFLSSLCEDSDIVDINLFKHPDGSTAWLWWRKESDIGRRVIQAGHATKTLVDNLPDIRATVIWEQYAKQCLTWAISQS